MYLSDHQRPKRSLLLPHLYGMSEMLAPVGGGVKHASSRHFGGCGFGLEVYKFSSLEVEKKLKRTLHSSLEMLNSERVEKLKRSYKFLITWSLDHLISSRTFPSRLTLHPSRNPRRSL